tara:strand:+ start:208037 stop:209368 length:1332 start_codon:yes stop_codon:yes gene_type:complete
MSIYGADLQEAKKPFSTEQINHFLRFCIQYADFTQEGLLRKDGPDTLIQHWHDNVLPLLAQKDVTMEYLAEKFLKVEADVASADLISSASSSRSAASSGKNDNTIHRTLLQVFKQLTSRHTLFLENESGQILQRHFLRQLQNYFWPMLLYMDEKFSDTECVREKKDEYYNINAIELFKESIAFLLCTGHIDLAETFHNILYIGYLCHCGNKIANTPFVVGKLIAPSLLFKSFDIAGKILPDENFWGKKEVTVCAEMISAAITSTWFQVPFSEQKFAYRSDMTLESLTESGISLERVAHSRAKRRCSDAQEQVVRVENPLYARNSSAHGSLISKMRALDLDKVTVSAELKLKGTHSPTPSVSSSASDSEPEYTGVGIGCASDSKSLYVPVLPLELLGEMPLPSPILRLRNVQGEGKGSDSDIDSKSDEIYKDKKEKKVRFWRKK